MINDYHKYYDWSCDGKGCTFEHKRLVTDRAPRCRDTNVLYLEMISVRDTCRTDNGLSLFLSLDDLSLQFIQRFSSGVFNHGLVGLLYSLVLTVHNVTVCAIVNILANTFSCNRG